MLAISLLFASFFAQAQTTNTSLKVDPNKPIRLEYRANFLNKNPEKNDTAYMLFRDAGTGSLARIEVQETGANTGVFVGSYQISFRPQMDILPELFMPPQEMIKSLDQMKRIETLIKEGMLLRKPFFLRQEGSFLQMINVFDTREQAIQAYEDYKLRGPKIPLMNRAALETQQRASMNAEKAGQAAQTAKNLSDRERLEVEARKKLEALKQHQAALSAAERLARLAQAKKLAEEAMEKYKKEDYKGAEEKFSKSSQLDPDNTSYAYQYGVTLYKNEKYNASLVALNVAKGADVNETERDYYMGLNHMKLKELDLAFKKFQSVKNKNDKSLSPSASFFTGIIDFQKENYDRAKTAFEYTLDNSSDPRMDQQAEAYIEQIANIKMFQANKAKKFIVGLNLGMMYDSNILNLAAPQSEATSLAGYRGTYAGSFEYRPVYSPSHEFSTTLSFNDMYSWDKNFQPSAPFQATDPLTFSLSFPYKYKGQAFGKPFQTGLTPAYETTYMDSASDKKGIGGREQIVTSTILKNDNTFIMTDDWFATYVVEVRRDTSLITVTVPDDSQTANKLTLQTIQTFFIDKKKTTAKSYEAGISMNQAEGKNLRYQRLDLAFSYVMPWVWGLNLNTRLAAYYVTYPENTQTRKDTDLAASLGLQKPINESFSAIVNMAYTNNQSNVATSNYNKYMIMTGVSYNNAF